MFKVTLYKSMNVRSGEVPLRFRLREDKDVDLALETGIKVAAVDLQAFGSDGAVRPGLKEYNLELKKEIDLRFRIRTRWWSGFGSIYMRSTRWAASVTGCSGSHFRFRGSWNVTWLSGRRWA